MRPRFRNMRPGLRNMLFQALSLVQKWTLDDMATRQVLGNSLASKFLAENLQQRLNAKKARSGSQP